MGHFNVNVNPPHSYWEAIFANSVISMQKQAASVLHSLAIDAVRQASVIR